MTKRIVDDWKPSQSQIHEMLNYNAETGEFTWKSFRAAGMTSPRKKAPGSLYRGYLRIMICGRTFAAHKLAWLHVYGVYPEQIDHINGLRADNRIANLRICDTQQNCSGRLLRKDNVSGYKGVSPVAHGNFVARIRVNYAAVYIGYYTDARQAALAYDDAAIRHFGRFARTNKMLGLL